MLHRVIAIHAPVLAVVAAILVVASVFLMEAGIAATIIAVTVLAVVTMGLAWISWTQNRRFHSHEKAVRQLRFIVERYQSMMRTIPGGYCLFTSLGLMREEVNVAACLGCEKVHHFDDLVAAIKEGPELVEAFRHLQLNGKSFALMTTALANQKTIQIAGRRVSIGREGPVIDILWFGDSPALIEQIQKSQEAKTEAESRVREVQALIDAIRFPVWARAQDLRIIMCNQAYAKALDATTESVLEQQYELTSQTARGGSGRSLAANALSHSAAETERRHVIIAGRRHLLEITEMPCGESAGKMSLLGFAVDVTSEEEKETELKRHMAAHREVMEHLGAAVCVFGADMKLEFYNRAYQRLWDADEAFLDSRPLYGELLEDYRSRRKLPEQADFQRFKKERMSLFTSLLEPREDLMYLPDGTSLRVLVAPHPFGGLMFVHEDVTDRLALESNYNTLIAVQRETLDNLAEGVAVFGPDGKLSLSNPAFARIWKLPHEYLASEPHIADLLEHMKPLFTYGANWDSFKNELVAYTLDRSSRAGRVELADQTVVETLTVPLPDGAVLNCYLDVSDSVKAEQALRASNVALTTADRLKSEFVANVSYQLRTPLNTIMGFAEILTNQYFGALNDRQLEYTRTIMDASKRLLLLINDVLDLATIEAGRMELERQLIPVADLLNSAKQMTAEWARQQSLDITIECPTDMGSFVVDEQRLKQVLFNLISNSIKFTPSGGQIRLEAKKQAPWIIMSVSDTGIGIPPADRERVFGKFERANTQARQSGAGLGLSLVKHFVELHGGRVEISAESAQGTRIDCYLPIEPEALLPSSEETAA